MKVTMRNYNGTYSIFVEMDGCKELVAETKNVAIANFKFKEYQSKVNSI